MNAYAPVGTDRTPLTVYLPFNVDCLRGEFVPAKRNGVSECRSGYWVVVQDQGLVLPDGPDFAVPFGDLPRGFEGIASARMRLGTWRGEPCWTASVPRGATLPEGFRRETIVPMQGGRLPDDLLTLGGIAMQALWWDSTSGFCPRCGSPTERMGDEWGKRCPRCNYDHYPHLHPAVIVLVRDGDRFLLARKPGWAPSRYALIAGFVDNGEPFESAVRREVKEEVGVDVDDVRYVGSQNWPFPSQVMVGFVARYAGGEIAVDKAELEDARWFTRDTIPGTPSRHSISGWIIENYALRDGPS